MPKGSSNCTVTADGQGNVSCNPDPVPVSRATQDGVQWTFATPGYTFTGITINSGNDDDFGTPSISTNAAGRSVMTVSDSVTHLTDYTYTLNYTDPDGNDGGHDPQIHNEA